MILVSSQKSPASTSCPVLYLKHLAPVLVAEVVVVVLMVLMLMLMRMLM